jgi:hypothetical protein
VGGGGTGSRGSPCWAIAAVGGSKPIARKKSAVTSRFDPGPTAIGRRGRFGMISINRCSMAVVRFGGFRDVRPLPNDG